MSTWQAQEALADGRQLWRVTSTLAPQFAPGQQLLAGEFRLPVLRADHDALIVIATTPVPADIPFALTGQPLAITEIASLMLVTHGDGLFAALAWLFRHRHRIPSGALRLLACFDGRLPFRPQPSRFLTPQLPAHVTAALPLLDDWQIVSRIAHPDGLPGCFDGEVAELIAAWQLDGDRVMTIR